MESRRGSAQSHGSEAAHRRSRSRFFHSLVDKLVASQVVAGSKVIDIGCADGSTLRACHPGVGVGIDLDPISIAAARKASPELDFREIPIEEVCEPPIPDPDYVLMSMLFDEVYDIQPILSSVNDWCGRRSRVVIVSYNRLWRPIIKLAELLHLKTRAEGENYVPWVEVENMLALEGFEVIKRLDGVLLPLRIPLIATVFNRWLAPLPILRWFSLIRVTVARPIQEQLEELSSVSVIVAARNESGHIRELIDRVPIMADRQELIFVEGNSTDDTWDVIQQAVAEYSGDPRMTLKALQQTGKGKGDAVRVGFDAATGHILMILDADISVPPEELPRFVDALRDDSCEFANGSRLVYPMDAKAMRFLNLLGNKFFGYLFSFLLSQPVRDTLCGTKVLRREDYERIAANREVFGDFDPFGDFDLLFGASYLGLRIRDVPVHYKERRYGETNISRFSHGAVLLRMAAFAGAKLKFVG
ncbi:MAG: glycosyltransferase [Actinomycetota bacterium]|nr:glycosyltransferase [Actinomycetota bacterium]